jgi:chromosome segregation ATPase
MADKGPLPTELQKKRITVEIRRLEHMIEFQEMECMDLENQILNKQENIEASKKDITKQRSMLANLEGPGLVDTN